MLEPLPTVAMTHTTSASKPLREEGKHAVFTGTSLVNLARMDSGNRYTATRSNFVTNDKVLFRGLNRASSEHRLVVTKGYLKACVNAARLLTHMSWRGLRDYIV